VLLGLYAGEASPFAHGVCFAVAAPEGKGVCTSSGTVGHSLSFGRADAVVAVAASAIEADAAATALANGIQVPADVDALVAREAGLGRLSALVACAGDRLGMWGEIEMRRTR
jgi:ApbE superfamily uncharacterized protein (UPF0280 family)